MTTKPELSCFTIVLVAFAMIVVLPAQSSANDASSADTISIPWLEPDTENAEWTGYFINEVTDPAYKEFQFIGTADNPDPDNPVTLRISFDYKLEFPNGAEIILTPLDGDNEIPAGATNYPVSARYTLDFCPEHVSIHFEAIGGRVENIQGTFYHVCIPGDAPSVPTLTEWGMIIFSVLLIGWMALMIVRRRQHSLADI